MTPRITDETYARIPALLEQGMTQAEIAAIYGVKLGSLKVLCSRHGTSLRKGGPLPKRTNLTLPDEPLPLSDDLFKAVLDDEMAQHDLADGKASAQTSFRALRFSRGLNPARGRLNL